MWEYHYCAYEASTSMCSRYPQYFESYKIIFESYKNIFETFEFIFQSFKIKWIQEKEGSGYGKKKNVDMEGRGKWKK